MNNTLQGIAEDRQARRFWGVRRDAPKTHIKSSKTQDRLKEHMSEMVGYARVSTRDQNLDAQVDQLKAAGCTQIFVDIGSGKTPRANTGLGRMLDYLRPDDVVVVTQLDRLSRSLIDLLTLGDQIGKKGAELRSLKEPFDTTKDHGRLMFHMMGMLAEFERIRIRERTLEGLQAARARGRVGGRPRRLSQKQEGMIWQLRQQGESIREIGRMFNVSAGTVSRALARREQATAEG